MNNPPLVSLIIPAFNHEKYVSYCLESIKTDGYSNLEIIICDDGSTDSTSLVIEKWIAKIENNELNIKFFKQNNLGITKTLNKLISLCTGEYIAILASDDALLHQGIERRMQHLMINPNWLAVFGNTEIINRDNIVTSSSGALKFKNRPRKSLDASFLTKELILRWWVPGPSLLLRKEAFDLVFGVGPYNELLCFEDRDMYLRLLSRNALGFLDYNVAQYRFEVELHKLKIPNERMIKDESYVDRTLSKTFFGLNRVSLLIRSMRMKTKLESNRKNNLYLGFKRAILDFIWVILLIEYETEKLVNEITLIFHRLLSKKANL